MYGTEREGVGSRKSALAMAAQARKVAPWPWATTPWNWDETLDQFQATRLPKHKVK